MSEEIVKYEAQSAPMNTGLAIFDSGQFENLFRVAEALGKSSLIPASLKGKTDEETTANCLLVAEQSHRWGLSPFAVAQCASFIHGRLMWEGKLVHAVIQSLAGINLKYDISGSGENMQIVVSGTLAGEDEPRTVTGTVKAWKTTGKGSPWDSPNSHERQLRYRGAREWCRAHNPAVMLGILSDDEELPAIRNVTPKTVPIKPLAIATNPFSEPESPAEPASKTEVAEPAGRQKKKRYETKARLVSCGEVEPAANGARRFKAVFDNGKQRQDFSIFSETTFKKIEREGVGASVPFTFTMAEKNGVRYLSIESVDVADTEPAAEEIKRDEDGNIEW